MAAATVPSPGPAPLPRRRALAALGGALAMGAGLTSCASPELAPMPIVRTEPAQARGKRVVRFANWPAYIDRLPGHPGVHPTLVEFTRRTGIAVDYSEPISDSQAFFGRIGVALAMGEDTGYDLVVLSDWQVAQLIALGWAQELSPALTPNAARLLPGFRNWPVHDVRRYSLPWQGGFTGIVYNRRVTGRPVTGMEDLLTAPDLRGRVSLVSDMRDVTGLTMLGLGIDPADFSRAEFASAIGVLGRAAQAKQIAFVSDYFMPPLIKGTTAACVGWSGDVLYYQKQYPEIRFVWPPGGGMVWTDNMVIPAGAWHRENAQRLMDFYYEPIVAGQLSAYEQYLCPVLGTKQAVGRVDPSLARQEYVFPPPELIRSGHFFKPASLAQSAALINSYATAVGL